jgi:hypothetical protein
MRKLVVDELMDTLFFATGEVVKKERAPKAYILTTPVIQIEVESHRKIKLNGNVYQRVYQVKDAIGRIII